MIDLSRVKFHTFMDGSTVCIAAEYDLQTEDEQCLVAHVNVRAKQRDRYERDLPRLVKLYVEEALMVVQRLQDQLEEAK